MQPLPRWSLDSIYSSPDCDAYNDNKNLLYKTCEAVELLAGEISELHDLEDISLWLKDVLGHVNMMSDLYENLESYAYTRFSVNTRDKAAQDTLQEIEEISLKVKSANVAITNAFGQRAEMIMSLCTEDPRLVQYTYTFERMIKESSHLMSPELEALAAELQRAGGDAWGRLQEAISSTSSILWDKKSGERKTVIELRSLAFHPDREIREKAYRKEIEIWRSQEIPLAYALNGVKGFTAVYDKRRSYNSSIEHSIEQARISTKTLDALIAVLEEAQPLFRTYFKKKAELLGLDRLSFYDLFAPINKDERQWGFGEAKDFITEIFSEFYSPMGEFAEYAFSHDWIDAEPDDGKVGGAYCIGFPLAKESRILCNFDGSFSGVSTVAHELGHAFHGKVLTESPALLRDYPMTLAETASIFSETVIFNGALKRSSIEQRLTMIESFLMDAAQTVVDILSRYYFESEVFMRRATTELTPGECCEVMADAQKRTYGDALNEEELHPYMWAVKGHYYGTDLAFYNYPYAFGQLFGMSLYAQYQSEGDTFCERYVRLLEQTGSESAETVTASAGFDIETKDFWRKGISILEGYIDEFCDLADERLK